MSPVTVVDYGLGNLHSVLKALRFLGAEPVLAQAGQEILTARRLILPGVGAFADGMRGLNERGLAGPIRQAVARGVPLLGICLGAQLLFDVSQEFGTHAGLGLIAGQVERIPESGVKVPHVGWNRLLPGAAGWAGTPLAASTVGTWAYFVHSYQMRPHDPDRILAVARHGSHALTAAVAQGRICGCQFHPEKSGRPGLAMLRTFLNKDAP